jgi:hypothetical protein
METAAGYAASIAPGFGWAIAHSHGLAISPSCRSRSASLLQLYVAALRQRVLGCEPLDKAMALGRITIAL